MGKIVSVFLVALLSSGANSQILDAPADEKSLNTANLIGAAWEVKRLSESLAPGVDTRCYIAKLAAFKANSLPDAARVVDQYKKTESDAFAIESVKKALEEFESNDVEEIAKKCK